jgi:high-affinity iron transporter
MLPTFVIGLREGLEAALIVSIIAAFLRKQGRGDLLRWVFVGVGTAVVLCLGVGAALEILSRNLPQRQQEGLETVVGGLAVVMVTYMVVWMRRHSRELKGVLEGAAAAALDDNAQRAGRALVVMAFLAVLREGFETVVFLLAAFNETGNGTGPVVGALLGIAVAVALGWGIYRGGVRLNLSKFFRATGLVLVLVAAGLVVTALHTAHEAGWLNAGQGSTVNLTWLVKPGSVRSSLLTGMLGVQDHPVVIEVVGWLVYLIPVGMYVAWPPGRSVAPRRVAIVAGILGAAAATAAVAVAVATPGLPASRPVTTAGQRSLQVVSADRAHVVVRMPTADAAAAAVTTHRAGTTTMGGLELLRTTATTTHSDTSGRSARLTDQAVARLNGGRLPLGVTAGRGAVPVTYADTDTVTLAVEPTTERVVSARWTRQVVATVHAAVGAIPLGRPVQSVTSTLPAATTTAAVTAARADLTLRRHHRSREGWAAGLAATAALGLLVASAAVVVGRRRSRAQVDTAPESLVGHEVSLT